MEKIVIVGAGAMGCIFAARLAEAGIRVTLVDLAGPRLDALRRAGVTIRDDAGERTVQLTVSSASEVVGPVDLVVLFTKAANTRAAVQSVAHLAAGHAVAMTLQNGLGNAEAIAEVFPEDRIVFGVTDVPADLEDDTSVSSHGRGRIWVGGFRPAAHGAATAIAARFQAAGMDAQADPQVEIAVWEKLAFNAALNAIAAVTGLTVGEMDAPSGRRIAFSVVDEVVAAAAARGLQIDRARIVGKIEHALAEHRGHKASMLQDLLAGRATEIEAINGAVAAVGAAAGVSMPVTGALADLVRLKERAMSSSLARSPSPAP
jgi:2-dehydropantoate 2-reductase